MCLAAFRKSLLIDRPIFCALTVPEQKFDENENEKTAMQPVHRRSYFLSVQDRASTS